MYGEDACETCPEPDCGIQMYTRDELIAHLQWNHNRSEVEAEAMLS